MTARAVFKKSDMNRLFSSAKANGYTSIEGRIMPDGSIQFHATDDATKPPEDWRKQQPLYGGEDA